MLREGTLDDIPRAASMRQRAWPESIVTEEGMRHWIAGVPARAEPALFAWEHDGELLGWATAARSWWQSDPDAGILSITVDPSRRGQGIGTTLAEAADAHLGRLAVRTTRARSLDEPGARALASRRGFTELAASTVSGVDPRTVEPRPIPAGVELVPLATLDDPAPIHALDLEVSRDIPNEDYDAIELEEWKAEFWRGPLIDDDASLVALVDGRVVGMTLIRIDRPSGRAQSNLCGVRRQYRGRGLAVLLKSHSLRRAAELGATIALTDNDETNAPMLAVNQRLGYRPFARRLEWERAAVTSAP
ncbi:MAG TPA: GNAT family N-acetyltransferase [Gaiella sp.]|jgi:GNAT superfamily N-acetyltransferase|nr:GNAT family N-acetyltransferase [Gaiella sp.]